MIIYMTINLINNKFYIGKDGKNDENYYGSGKVIKESIKKYGKDNFIKITLEECLNLEDLNSREIYWINFFESIKYGYNIALGGDGGDTISNHPEKISIAEEHSKKMKLEKYNKRIGNKFEPLSNEVKEKIRSKLIGKSWGSHSTETIELLSFLKIGDKNPFYGKKHTEEAKKNISDKNKHPKSEDTKIKLKESLLEYYMNGNKPTNTKKIFINGQIFLGYTEASKSTGLSISQIRTRIKSEKYPDFYHE